MTKVLTQLGGRFTLGTAAVAPMAFRRKSRTVFEKRDNEIMTEQEMIRRWAQTWKEAGPELEKIRLREVRDEDNLLSLRMLARLFNHATRTEPPGDSSGLIEMQRHLAKLRR